MNPYVDIALTQPDKIVLSNLTDDIQCSRANGNANGHSNGKAVKIDDQAIIEELRSFNDPKSSNFQPTVFTSWDEKDINPTINRWLVQPYASLASKVVRRPTDVVFVTHLLIYLGTSVPSAVLLFLRFSWPHAIFHWLMQAYYCGPFTLMMHNHIHNNGILAKGYGIFDNLWPYVIQPLMGHTWNSYYYHHVKHHHVENNGPGDLSSTIRYQRDEIYDFACYVGRFLFFIWLELPLYFHRKRKEMLAFKSATWEIGTYVFIYVLSRLNFRAACFVLIIPLIQMRIGMMVGNWGQHCLVDEQDPNSDFRSSITLIDVSSNRHCFNDGYHTSHHLNPLRHWRDHPAAFTKAKPQYADGRALVFKNIDYIFMTIILLKKDYMGLASRLVPIGDQVNMSLEEIADLLRTKTKKFSDEDILRLYGKLQ